MEEKLINTLKAIQRTAEIVLEHHMSRPLRNTIITVGIESIISLAKELIEDIEKVKKEE
jgi:sugar-specific transcriptional regulator TrmB